MNCCYVCILWGIADVNHEIANLTIKVTLCTLSIFSTLFKKHVGVEYLVYIPLGAIASFNIGVRGYNAKAYKG